MSPETIRFPIRGMTCGACVSRITRSLRALDGVAAVRVDLGRETATVRREPARVSEATLAAAVSRAGYEADIAALEVLPPEPARRPGLLDRLLRRP